MIAKANGSESDSSNPFSNKSSNNRYGINNESDDEDEEAHPASAPKAEDTSALFDFTCTVIKEFAVDELKTPEEADYLDNPHPNEKQYGNCRKPFGLLRMRIIEFLTEAYKAFYRPELHKLFLDTGLYNSLLFFFDHYPFHNILHMKVCDIFLTLLAKADESTITSILDETHLLRKILDTAREGSMYTLQSTGNSLSRGYMPFIRKIANKLADLSQSHSEI